MKPNKRSSRLLALALSLVLSLSLSLPALAAGEDDIIYIHTAKGPVRPFGQLRL